MARPKKKSAAVSRIGPAPARARTDRHAVRYVAAPGANFGDDRAAVYGRELDRIARENAINGVASLDKRLVYDAVQADPDSPLREFVFDRSDAEAADAYRLQRCALLIRSIRIIAVTMGPRPRPMPQFVAVDESVRRRVGAGTKRERGRVLTLDVMRSEPLFAGAVSVKIRMANQAIQQLERFVEQRPVNDPVRRLADGLRAVFDDYFEAMHGAAAEE